ncbi:hypothetical protein EV361DRAFT_811683, partial [Lentinula raphanica]
MPPPPEVLLGIVNEWILAGAHVVQLVVLVGALYASTNYWNQPYHTSILTGQEWVNELIRGHPERIHTELGVHLHVFAQLIVHLRQMGYRDS